MLFSVEATKALITAAVDAIPYGKLVQLALKLQAGTAIKLDADIQPLAGFMVIDPDSELGSVHSEYKSIVVEAVGLRILQNSASARALENIVREGLAQKANCLSEIIVGLENNEMRTVIVPSPLAGMFITVDANKNTSRPKSSFYDVIKRVASVLYCERETV